MRSWAHPERSDPHGNRDTAGNRHGLRLRSDQGLRDRRAVLRRGAGPAVLEALGQHARGRVRDRHPHARRDADGRVRDRLPVQQRADRAARRRRRGGRHRAPVQRGRLPGRHPRLARVPPGVLPRPGRQRARVAPPLRAARREADGRTVISIVTEADLTELLPLMRAYCDFYGADTGDDALLALSHALIEDPERDGVQLIARNEGGDAIGFATVFWTWSTLRAARIGVMNDLFVAAEARGTGLAEKLIDACLAQCRRRGACSLGWQTARDNERAQAVYERVGARREEWVDYTLEV